MTNVLGPLDLHTFTSVFELELYYDMLQHVEYIINVLIYCETTLLVFYGLVICYLILLYRWLLNSHGLHLSCMATVMVQRILRAHIISIPMHTTVISIDDHDRVTVTVLFSSKHPTNHELPAVRVEHFLNAEVCVTKHNKIEHILFI